MHYFQFEIKEWLSNTAHLTLEEEAIYLRLINWYYDSEKPIPKDTATLFRKLRIVEQCGIAQMILVEFFVPLETGEWIHKRCDEEITKYRAKSEQASRAGKASALKRSNVTPTPVQRTFNQSLIINQESLINNHISETPNGFDLFWSAYNKKKGKANALKVWKSLKIDNVLLQTIIEKAKIVAKTIDPQFRKDPERWLKGKHWEDELILNAIEEPKELPLGTDAQIEHAYRTECGGDPTKARFNSYFDMRKFILDQRDRKKQNV